MLPAWKYESAREGNLGPLLIRGRRRRRVDWLTTTSRIRPSLMSAIKRFPLLSTATENGPPNCADVAGPPSRRLLHKIRNKQSRRVKYENHVVSKQIVDYAAKHGRAIVLEKLENVRGGKHWSLRGAVTMVFLPTSPVYSLQSRFAWRNGDRSRLCLDKPGMFSLP